MRQLIPALSLWQPWASLIAWGEKSIETRGWSTAYRGPLAIHAAKRKPTQSDIVNMKKTFFRVAAGRITKLEDLPRGAVLCIVQLEDCIPTRASLTDTMLSMRLSQQEFVFGNYLPERFGWKLTLLEVFDTPVPAKGAQGMWKWEWKQGHVY